LFNSSDDAGVTWKPFVDPCGSTGGDEQDGSVWAAGPGSSFAVLCVPRPGNGPITLRLSEDRGGHFGPALPTPLEGVVTAQLAFPGGGQLLIATAGSAGTPSAVYRSIDGGVTWAQVLTAPALPDGAIPAPWLGFQDSTVGRVTFATTSLWTTRDGGATWRQTTVG
jgi:hypothetical protein